MPLKITIIRTTSLGDVILATAVLDFLQKLPIATAITWLGRPPTLGVLAASFPGINAIPLTKETTWRQLYQQLSASDVVIDLQQSVKTRLVCTAVKLSGRSVVRFSDKLYGLRHRLLAAAKSRAREGLLPDDALNPPVRQYQVAVQTTHDALWQVISSQGAHEETNRLKEAFSAALSSARPKLTLPAEQLEATAAKISAIDSRFAQASSTGLPFVAVAPGASYPTKRAPVATFAEILTKAHARSPFGIVMLGDGQDSAVCEELAARLSSAARLSLAARFSLAESPVIDLSGKLSFIESVATLALCRVVLGNDSVLPHCSEALGRPSLTMFGPTIEGFGFAPFRPDSRSLSVNLGCRPCSKHGQMPCRFEDLACFTRLPVPQIAAELSSIVSVS